VAAWLALAWVVLVVAGAVWPVTAAARDGDRHGGCQTASGPGPGRGGPGPGDGCRGAGEAAAQATAAPAPTASPPPPTAPAPVRTGGAVATPLPTQRPAAGPAAAADLRPTLLVGGAVVALAALVAWGFRARRRLRLGWD